MLQFRVALFWGLTLWFICTWCTRNTSRSRIAFIVLWWVILQSQLPSVEHPGNMLPSVILDAPSRNWFHLSLFVQTLIWGGQCCSICQSVHSHNVLIQGPANKHGGSICYSKRDPARGCLITAWQKTTVAHLQAISTLQAEFSAD